MKAVCFDTVSGVWEVDIHTEWDEDTEVIGTVTDIKTASDWLKEDFEGVRGMVVSQEVFDWIDKVYHISK